MLLNPRARAQKAFSTLCPLVDVPKTRTYFARYTVLEINGYFKIRIVVQIGREAK